MFLKLKTTESCPLNKDEKVTASSERGSCSYA